jgi:hypothetical protein
MNIEMVFPNYYLVNLLHLSIQNFKKKTKIFRDDEIRVAVPRIIQEGIIYDLNKLRHSGYSQEGRLLKKFRNIEIVVGYEMKIIVYHIDASLHPDPDLLIIKEDIIQAPLKQ